MLLCTHWAGMRVGEVAALRYENVVAADGSIYAELRLTVEQTKGGQARVVYAPEKLRKEPEAASGQVDRVARRFAVVAAADELATEAGITGWPEGEAIRGARRCFEAWLESRGGIGNVEEVQMLRQVRRFLESHGEACFTEWNRAKDDHAPKTMHRAGFRRSVTDSAGDAVGWEFYVLIEAFRSEICEGFEYKAVLRVLRDRGYLEPDKGRPYDCTVRVPGHGKPRCYRVTSKIFDDALSDD